MSKKRRKKPLTPIVAASVPPPRGQHNRKVSDRFVVVEGRYGGRDRTIVDTIEGREVCEFHSRYSADGADAAYFAGMVANLLNQNY